MQQLLATHRKPLLSLFYDEADLTRELAVRLAARMVRASADSKDFLPYIYSVLVERLNCEDMEGILALPEVMRPAPGQKPKVLIKLAEKVEEVRL